MSFELDVPDHEMGLVMPIISEDTCKYGCDQVGLQGHSVPVGVNLRSSAFERLQTTWPRNKVVTLEEQRRTSQLLATFPRFSAIAVFFELFLCVSSQARYILLCGHQAMHPIVELRSQ